jgi:hypothetical protein
MKTDALPDLWVDWCLVTGTRADQIDESTVDRFTSQVQVPQAVLQLLRTLMDPPEQLATVWPGPLQNDPDSLNRLLRQGSLLINSATTHWIARLRIRRLLFAGVLLAPRDFGGAGLSRREALGLAPSQLQAIRGELGTGPSPGECPRCAVWSWLEVIGTNNSWSHGVVRELAHRTDESDGRHRHLEPDPRPDWGDALGLLPAIDQWGYINPYGSLHPSSLSVLVHAIFDLIDGPVLVQQEETSAPEPGIRHFSAAEEAEVLARADQLNAHITKVLAEQDAVPVID